MLDAIDYRGDQIDRVYLPGVALGYRWWAGRPGKSPGIHQERTQAIACAGTLAPPVINPAADLLERLGRATPGLEDLDGAFGAAWWDGDRRRLTLIRDPFGVRSLYYVEHEGAFF